MSNRKPKPPKLCRHKSQNLAYVRINGKQIYLGRWGSTEAWEEFERNRTFGTLRYSQASHWWRMECDPHVTLWARRLFAKLPKGQTSLELRETPSTCADIAWFMLRDPLRMSNPDRDRLMEIVDGYEHQIEHLDQIVEGKRDGWPSRHWKVAALRRTRRGNRRHHGLQQADYEIQRTVSLRSLKEDRYEHVIDGFLPTRTG